MMRRLLGVLLIIVGAAAVSACLRSAFTGVRDVMRSDGGTCASGGPYVIAQQCSSGDVRLIMVGIIGGLVAAAIYAFGTSALGRSAGSAGLVAWIALFGVLGWNFISLGLHPAAGTSGASTSWLISGGVFWMLALGGLVPLVGSLASDLRGNRPSPATVAAQPLVRAIVLPGFPAPQDNAFGGWTMPDLSVPPAPARAATLLQTGLWLLASFAGAGLGIALSSSLVNLLAR